MSISNGNCIVVGNVNNTLSDHWVSRRFSSTAVGSGWLDCRSSWERPKGKRREKVSDGQSCEWRRVKGNRVWQLINTHGGDKGKRGKEANRWEEGRKEDLLAAPECCCLSKPSTPSASGIPPPPSAFAAACVRWCSRQWHRRAGESSRQSKRACHRCRGEETKTMRVS